MNNENNVNTTQNPNVTNTNNNSGITPEVVPVPTATVANTEVIPTVAPAPGVVPAVAATPEVPKTEVQTIVVPSEFPEEAPATVVSNVNMPSVVNPLEIKAEPENKEEVKPVVKSDTSNAENPVKEVKVSEYEEKLRKAQENYKPPGKFQMALTIFMFIMFILFIIFLPDISENIRKLKEGPVQGPEPDPTTGTLTCTLESNTSTLDKTFKREFKYEDNKLKSAVIETSTRGDITQDEATLDELYNKCETIKSGVNGVSGVTIVCEYKEGLLTERERFDYKTFDKELIDAAYAEAGSSVLEYDYDTDIDGIMKSMLQAGFTCKKEKK